MARILPARVLLVLIGLGFLCVEPAKSQFPNRQFPSPLNNGSLRMTPNPTIFSPSVSAVPTSFGPAGIPLTGPGTIPFTGIAGTNQDLRLLCNGVAVDPWRAVVALNGWPAASVNKQIIQTPGQPPQVINLGFGISPIVGTSGVAVRPWFPVDDVSYQICGWGCRRDPRQQYPTSAMGSYTPGYSGYHGGPVLPGGYGMLNVAWKPLVYIPYGTSFGGAGGFEAFAQTHSKIPETQTQSPGESQSQSSETSESQSDADKKSDNKKSEAKDKKSGSAAK